MSQELEKKRELAALAMSAYVDFETALQDKRRYPREQFRRFFEAVRGYADATQNDELVHRELASSVSGLREFIAVERKRVPDDVLFDADRLHSILFAGYDPSFHGDEPQGL